MANDIDPHFQLLASLLAVQSSSVPTKDELREILQRYQTILKLLCEVKSERIKLGQITQGEYSFV